MKSTSELSIYEINTAAFLHDISKHAGRRVTLDKVPEKVWDDIADLGVKTVWLMGVWKRSPIARAMALKEPFLKNALPDLKQADVYGSAYSIKEYTVDERFGGDEGLAIARQALKRRGISLMLDYVPNHVAIDHPWTTYHPEYFLTGTTKELERYPDAFIQTPSGIMAKAKDPHYDPWSDVVQLNAFSVAARQAFADTLVHIASMCDAVRCDMAMLMTNKIFARTWEKRAGKMPNAEFWPGIIKKVKKSYPNFIFLAEVYWQKEQMLLDQGFDFCYDKEFYDALIDPSVTKIRKHLARPVSYQRRMLRFIENHDEPRAAESMPIQQHKAAAVLMALSPSGVLYHEGQFEGRRLKVPVQLSRRPQENPDQDVVEFYRQLLKIMQTINPQKARWKVCTVRTNSLFKKSSSIVAWQYNNRGSKYLIAVNYSDAYARGILDIRHPKNGQQVFGSYDKWSGDTIHLYPWQFVIIRLA